MSLLGKVGAGVLRALSPEAFQRRYEQRFLHNFYLRTFVHIYLRTFVRSKVYIYLRIIRTKVYLQYYSDYQKVEGSSLTLTYIRSLPLLGTHLTLKYPVVTSQFRESITHP